MIFYFGTPRWDRKGQKGFARFKRAVRQHLEEKEIRAERERERAAWIRGVKKKIEDKKKQREQREQHQREPTSGA